jgi:hypothetical protein
MNQVKAFTVAVFKDAAIKRFWSKVEITTPDECWEWTARKDKDGYGLFTDKSTGRGPWRANRYAYTMENGEIPSGMLVCHRCDNPACVNPAHLWIGSIKDNNRDKVLKGRGAIGEMNGNSKMSELDVRAVREMKKEGIPALLLADWYGMSWHRMAKIMNGFSWQHIK